MQTELLNRRRWRTSIELANAIFEYLEIFHNRRRRHSALGMLTPTRELPKIQRLFRPGKLLGSSRARLRGRQRSMGPRASEQFVCGGCSGGSLPKR
jgi:hypothetical protein